MLKKPATFGKRQPEMMDNNAAWNSDIASLPSSNWDIIYHMLIGKPEFRNPLNINSGIMADSFVAT